MQDVLETAGKYWSSAGRTGLAHYRAAEVAAKRNKQIGIPNAAISAVVATSIFATLSDSIDIRRRIATGAIAIIAAILAALQAFLNFGDRAEKHKASGAKYGGLRRKIDLFKLEFSGNQSSDRQGAIDKLSVITNELNALATESPTLASAIYDQAKQDFDSTHTQ